MDRETLEALYPMDSVQAAIVLATFAVVTAVWGLGTWITGGFEPPRADSGGDNLPM